MTTHIVFLILGLLLLFAGGEGLVRGSAVLALRLGLQPLVIGLTVVAFGTSSPELVVSIKAALQDQGAIAAGNVIGSNIFNIGLILGLTALICPLKVQLQLLRIDAPIVVVLSLLALWVLGDQRIGRAEGALLSGLLVAYTAFTVIYARKHRPAAGVEAEFAQAIPAPVGGLWRELFLILAGLGLLMAGSRLLVDGAVGLARGFGISEAVIGLTIVAAGTSMPELVTSLVAALKKEPDVALGNIIGSNIFNLLGILGMAALIKPLDTAGIQPRDLWVAIGFAAALIPILWSGLKLQLWEGALLLAGYGFYLSALWPK